MNQIAPIKRIAIFGSTGSIGTQALEVIAANPEKFSKVKEALSSTDIKVFCGEKALEDVAAMDVYDLMLAAIVGYAGLKPTLKAVKTGKAIALANKETLVVAGDIIMRKA